MFKKDIYKYRDDKGRTIISPYQPNCEYEHMYRLLARSEDYRLTNYVIFAQCIDIQEKDLELWFEVHKDDLETPVSQNEEILTKIDSLYRVGRIVANQVTDDAIAQELQDFYDEWVADAAMVEGAYVNYTKVLYRVLTSHTSQIGWEPDKAPSLFARVLTDPSGETILDWVQPDSTNAYMTGDKVIYEGVIYESLIDNNVWSPADYPDGWQKVE